MTFRSVDMAHFRLFLPRENCYQSVVELLHLGNAHILDIGSPLNRPFFPQVKRCDELLLKLHFILEAFKERDMHFEEYNEMENNYVDDLQQIWSGQAKKMGLERTKLLDHYENEILQNWNRFQEKKNSLDKLNANLKEALAKIACYEALGAFFGEGRYLNDVGLGGSQGISTMIGVIDPINELKLSRTVYRASRGYAFIRSFDNFMFEGLMGFGDKVVIMIFPNSSTGVLEKKLQRIMQTFCNSVMQLRDNQHDQQQLRKGRNEYEQIMHLQEMNEKQLMQLLESLRHRHCIQTWRTYLWKQKLVYQTLNKMQLREHFLVTDLYIPRLQKDILALNIRNISPTPEIQELPVDKPPTAFDTNCYTIIPQQIVDTYGVPRYQQINPAILTTVTFPFFFGVMFGDIAHGLIILGLGTYLVLFNQSIKKSSMSFACNLRYMVLMMGFFAVYCGWVYNDFLGMNLNIFGSCYDAPDVKEDTPIQPRDQNCIYPFGVDPIWGVSSNQLIFVNSLKMKLSVIIAILHMTVGVILKFFNALHFKKPLQIVFEFIPQLLFLGLLFGYMDFLIIYKWLNSWTHRYPPSIISTMMDVGLKVGSTESAHAMWGQSGNSSQDTIQVIILVIAVICIPVMLLPKPIIQIKAMKKIKKMNPLLEDELEEERQARLNFSEHSGPVRKEHHEEQHEPGEIFVHQLIQTIEFVLGAISNTASYLRLWALSLAHSQLAKVFFQKTLEMGFVGDQAVMAIIMMPIMFYVLVWVTFGVLMCMDSMQCFLHSLRLHWVQFQNKFFKGDGYKYDPISFKKYILAMKQENPN